MNLSFLGDYIVLCVLGICLCTGYAIKNLIPGDGVNRFIPAIMAALGVFINVWCSRWSITPAIVLGGMVSGLASTGMYEAMRNLFQTAEK